MAVTNADRTPTAEMHTQAQHLQISRNKCNRTAAQGGSGKSLQWFGPLNLCSLASLLLPFGVIRSLVSALSLLSSGEKRLSLLSSATRARALYCGIPSSVLCLS